MVKSFHYSASDNFRVKSLLSPNHDVSDALERTLVVGYLHIWNPVTTRILVVDILPFVVVLSDADDQIVYEALIESSSTAAKRREVFHIFKLL